MNNQNLLLEKKTIFEEFSDYVTKKVKSPKKQKLPEISFQNKLQSIVKKNKKIKYNQDSDSQNSTAKFEAKMKTFKVLDSYVNVKDYFKKINLIYNPQMEKVLSVQTKKNLRKAFYDYTGIEVKEQIDKESAELKSATLTDFLKKTIKERKQSLFDNKQINDQDENLLHENIQNKISKTLTDHLNINCNIGKSHEENQNTFYNILNEKIEEEYKKKENNNLPPILKFKLLYKKKGSPRKSNYDLEIEKYQNLIENSIDFNLIHKIKPDEDQNPSSYYYDAYKEHAKKVQSILTKTCKRLYNKKLQSISENNETLANKLKTEAEKLKDVISIKLPNNLKKSNKNKKSSLINQFNKVKIFNDDEIENKKKFFIKDKYSVNNKSNKTNLSVLSKKNKETIHNFTNISNLNTKSSQKEINQSLVRSYNYSCLNLIGNISIEEKDFSDKKLLFMKEIDDIDEIAVKDFRNIKNRTIQQIDSIRDVSNHNTDVNKKIKMLKLYFNNKNKGKFILKL